MQCWVCRRQLSARLAMRRRESETARLGREILAQLASGHEAPLGAAADGEGSSQEEEREGLQLSDAERVEDARAWAAVKLRRLTGVTGSVVEDRLRQRRQELQLGGGDLAAHAHASAKRAPGKRSAVQRIERRFRRHARGSTHA